MKSVGSDTTVYSYQGLSILYEKDTTTGTVTKHFYADGLQVAKMVGPTAYYLHQDALGSTRLVMTATPSVQFSSDYVPYGLSYATTGSETRGRHRVSSTSVQDSHKTTQNSASKRF